MAKGWTDKRPMSPHLSIWKWHPTMLSSILHRMTGVILYFGLLALVLLLVLIASGEEWFLKLSSLVYSPIGAVLFFLVCGVLVFHLLNGLRHLVWDIGKGFDAKKSNMISVLIIIASAIIAAVLSWVLIGAI